MSPALTSDAAAWFDSQVRACLSDIACTDVHDLAWLVSTLPCRYGGLGLTSATATRHSAHYGSWASSWHNITRTWHHPHGITHMPTPLALSLSQLPFAVGLRAAHASVSASLTSLTDNLNNHPLPSCTPQNPSVPDPLDLSVRHPRAQKRFAAVVHGARWLDAFEVSTLPMRAILLSSSKPGANFAFNAVPSTYHAVLPTSFINALQLRLRLPLSLLAGINVCKCGAAIDPYGDHCLSCAHFQHLRTPWHDLIVDIIAAMARRASHHISYDSRRPRAASITYSPLWRPDLTLLHGSDTGTHVLIDATTSSVVSQSALPMSARSPTSVTTAAAAAKYARYGNVQPHVVLPFAVEHAGGLGKEAFAFVKRCMKKVRNELSGRENELSNWSCRGFSNYYLQRLSLATVKGLGHYFSVSAAILRTHNHIPH